MNVAIIPARGGSKRIPLKNIRSFVGKPIIAYSIEAAKQCGLFARIAVSTDHPRIADVARQNGADVPFMRPAALADDHTGTMAVVKHALQWFETNGPAVDFACCIYATAPLINAEYLRRGLQLLTASNRSFALGVTSFPFPIQRGLRIKSGGTVEPFWPAHMDTRSQELEPAFHDAGQFCWGRREAFMNDVSVYSDSALGVLLPRHLVQDIDTLEDWERAELIYKAHMSGMIRSAMDAKTTD